MSDQRFETQLSIPRWCRYQNQKAVFEKAKISWPDQGAPTTESKAWLDALLNNGIDLDHESGQPRIMVISGPPGSGKTKLALELCYRLATAEENKKCCVYLSLDTSHKLLRKAATSFGWTNGDPFPEWPPGKLPKGREFGVWLYDRDSARGRRSFFIDQLTRHAFESVGKWAANEPASLLRLLMFLIGWTVDFATGGMRLRIKRWIGRKFTTPLDPQILVVDSLNIMDEKSRQHYFEQFLHQKSKNLQLVIFAMDSDSGSTAHEQWEYISDIVIRLEALTPKSPGDYLLRTIQIQKARYQDHVWGLHQLKIYGKPPSKYEPSGGEPHLFDVTNERRHPFLNNEGGIFIFPSIHYYLSKFKRASSASASHENLLPIYPSRLEKFFQLPRGRCAAVVGSRGTHKSRLGYMQILSNIANYGLGMIISLRDDEKMTIRALRKILEQEEDLRNIVIQKLHMRIEMEEDDSEQSYDRDSLELLIEKLIKNNILKILYYPPGNVTPDEFFHRMFVSLQAMQYLEREKYEAERQDGGPQNANPDCSKILVLFNSLDQLGARFPLCVQEQLFIPGMVQVFAGSKVSSIFISVEELGVIAKRDGAEAARHYGLLPMADLILRIKMAEEVSSSEAIEMRVDRNAGGEPVGHKAWLELKTKGPNMGLRRIDDPSKKGK